MAGSGAQTFGTVLDRSLDPATATYSVDNLLLTWNTAVLPDDAVITDAQVTLQVTSTSLADDVGITADWYVHPGPTCVGCVDLSDYTSTPVTGAIDTPAELVDPIDGANTFQLYNADVGVNKTGTSGLRMMINGATPTARNRITIDTSAANAPKLELEYWLPGDAGTQLSASVALRPWVLPRDPAPSRLFDRSGAVLDSDVHVHNYRGSPFEAFSGTDCTNFVSQAWHFGGGLKMTSAWYLKSIPWYTWLFIGGEDRDYTAAWVRARSFANYMVNTRHIATYRVANMSLPFNPALPGDAILYDWGRGEGWSHLAIEQFFDGNRDYINQHTTDRLGSPWNLGYHLEHNPQIQLKMRALVVHVADQYAS